MKPLRNRLTELWEDICGLLVLGVFGSALLIRRVMAWDDRNGGQIGGLVVLVLFLLAIMILAMLPL